MDWLHNQGNWHLASVLQTSPKRTDPCMVYLKKKIQPRCRSTYRFFMGISHGGSSIPAKLNRVSKQKLPHGRLTPKSIRFGKKSEISHYMAVGCISARVSWAENGFMEPI